MRIEEKLLHHWINNFYGYGSWNARIWFISYEESGGEIPEDVVERLNYFKKAHGQSNPALTDIRELYRHLTFRWDSPKASLFTNHHDHRFGRNAILNNVWKNLMQKV